MNLLNVNRWKLCNTLLIISFTFQMLIAGTPASASIYSGNPSFAGNRGNIKYAPVPLKGNERMYFFSAFTGNETINEVESYLSIDRNTLGFKGLILRFMKLLIPIAGFGLLVLCLGYVINKKEQHKSVLSILLGGHAPPYRFLLKTN